MVPKQFSQLPSAKNLEIFENQLKTVWAKIDSVVLRNLIDGMINKVKTCLELNGGYIGKCFFTYRHVLLIFYTNFKYEKTFGAYCRHVPRRNPGPSTRINSMLFRELELDLALVLEIRNVSQIPAVAKHFQCFVDHPVYKE